MLKFLHCADLHLGASFESIDSSKRETAQTLHFRAFEGMLEQARLQECAIIFLAGDLFHSPKVEFSFANRVLQALGRAHCPVVISPGNHDYIWDESPYLRYVLPQNVTVFQSRQLESITLEALRLKVYGAAFQNTGAQIGIHESLCEDYTNVLVLHGDLYGQSAYNPLEKQEIAESGFDYLALGHNHEQSGLLKAGKSFYACSGAFMGTGFDECDEKGYYIGMLGDGQCSLEFINSQGLSFLEKDVDISQIEEKEDFISVIGSIKQQNKACLRLNLFGEKRWDIDASSLERSLGKLFFYFRLRDESEEAFDLWANVEEENLAGAVSRRFLEKHQQADSPDEKKRIEKALKYALVAILY